MLVLLVLCVENADFIRLFRVFDVLESEKEIMTQIVEEGMQKVTEKTVLFRFRPLGSEWLE